MLVRLIADSVLISWKSCGQARKADQPFLCCRNGMRRMSARSGPSKLRIRRAVYRRAACRKRGWKLALSLAALLVSGSVQVRLVKGRPASIRWILVSAATSRPPRARRLAIAVPGIVTIADYGDNKRSGRSDQMVGMRRIRRLCTS